MLSLILCVISFALVIYGIFLPNTWKNKNGYSFDVERFHGGKVMNENQKALYIALKNKVENDMCGDARTPLTLCCLFVYMFAFMKLFSDFGIGAFWGFVISLACIAVLYFLFSLVISKWFLVADFDVLDVVNEYKRNTENQSIEDMTEFVLCKHHWYLSCIAKGEMTRKSIHYFGIVLAIVALVFALIGI